jgi:Fe-S cluster biogenesis protein NfuA
VTIEPSRIYANVCRFVVEPAPYPGGAIHVPGRDEAADSALAQRLFQMEDVTELLIAGDSLTVTTAQAAAWEEFGARVASAIRDQFESGTPSVSPEHRKRLPSADVIREKVQRLIGTAIAPALASHGGEVRLLDVRGNTVYLEFAGGCRGCGMAHVTLKYGVERLIREHVPEVGEVLDTTDHAGGTNPYYTPQPR